MARKVPENDKLLSFTLKFFDTGPAETMVA